MSTRASAWLWPALALLAACGSPIVGAECRHGYVRCDGVCIDPLTDPGNCGTCGHECGALACSAAECGPGLRDGGTAIAGDASTPDDSMDASVQDGGGKGPGEGRGTAGSPFSPDAGANFSGCGLGERDCGGVCANTQIDHDHCGACGIACEADQFCVAGMCKDACVLPLHLCHGGCVDYENDPNNCGSCGHVCLSGICSAGECADVVPGSLVVIGHDYSAAASSITLSMKRIAGNTVLLASGTPVRVLVYRGKAKAASCNGTLDAIDAIAALDGRQWESTEVDADEVTERLFDVDVFVICSQGGASDTQLEQLGDDWGLAMAQFLYRGGVVALFETQTASNTGTYHLLEPGGLFAAASRAAVSPARQDLVREGPALGVTGHVTSMYRSSPTTVHFLGVQSDGAVLVKDNAGEAVVIHRLIAP